MMSSLSGSNARSSEDLPRFSRLPVKIQKQERQSFRSRSTCRSAQKKPLEKNVGRSKSTLGEPLRLSRQRSGSLLKQTTPLGYNAPKSTRKSPMITSAKKDNRPVSDKRWQYEQVVKIKNFVVANVPEVDHNNIKQGISLDSFIILMGRLFQMIDKRLVINKENYLEEIPSNLKLFNYPVVIKPSLMKSVNTGHSWPAVVAIISWLIDLICKCNAVEVERDDLRSISETCIMKLVCSEFDDYTCVEDPIQEMDLKLVKFFNIDEQAILAVKNEIEQLKATEEEYEEKLKRNNEEKEMLKKRVELIKQKCNEYTTAQKEFESNIDENRKLVTVNIKKLDEELELLHSAEENLKTTTANQPHSLAEKQALMKEIEVLHNTVKLKEDRCQQQSDLVHKIDHEISELQQKLQADAYKYNNTISQLELQDFSLKERHIRERGFMKSDTKDELQRVEKLLRVDTDKVKGETKNMQIKMQKLTEQIKLISEQFLAVIGQFEEANKTDTELQLIIEQKNMEADVEKQTALDCLNLRQTELAELNNHRPCVKSLEQEIINLKQNYTDWVRKKDDFESRALEFFVNYDSQINDTIKEYMKIMGTVTGEFNSMLQKLVEDSKARVAFCNDASAEIETLKKKCKQDAAEFE